MTGRKIGRTIAIAWLVGTVVLTLVLWKRGVFNNSSPVELMIIVAFFFLVIAGAIWGKGS